MRPERCNVWNKIRFGHQAAIAGLHATQRQSKNVPSLTRRSKSVVQYVRRRIHIVLILCPVGVSQGPFALIPLLHPAPLFSCQLSHWRQNRRAKLDRSGRIMRLNQSVGVKADHLGFSSSLQSLHISPTLLISSEAHPPNSALSG